MLEPSIFITVRSRWSLNEKNRQLNNDTGAALAANNKNLCASAPLR